MAAATDTSSITDRGPIAPSSIEQKALQRIAQVLSQSEQRSPKFVTATGEEIELPPTLLRILRAVTAMLGADRAIVLESFGPLVSRYQAAELIGVPLNYVERLVNEGELSLVDAGPTKLLSRDAVLDFRRGYKARQRESLEELARISQEMGLYDLDYSSVQLKRLQEFAEEDESATGQG
jgi:excisionase family DNA binding protein